METNMPRVTRHEKVQLQYDWPSIKESTIASLLRYRDSRVPTGDFLRAVLENNLSSAFAHADAENMSAMRDIVAFCRNELPSLCWGSPEKVHDWIVKADQVSADVVLRDSKTNLWFVRFAGKIQAPSFEEASDAAEHLKRLQTGEEQANPYHWDVHE